MNPAAAKKTRTQMSIERIEAERLALIAKLQMQEKKTQAKIETLEAKLKQIAEELKALGVK